MSATNTINGQTVSTARIPSLESLASGDVVLTTERDFYNALFVGDKDATSCVRDRLYRAEALMLHEMAAMRSADNGLLDADDEAYFFRLMDSYTTLSFIVNLIGKMQGVGLVAKGVHHE